MFNIFRFSFDWVSIFVWDTDIETKIFQFQEIKTEAKPNFGHGSIDFSWCFRFFGLLHTPTSNPNIPHYPITYIRISTTTPNQF